MDSDVGCSDGEIRRRRTVSTLRLFAVVYAVGLGVISAALWRGDVSSPVYDVVNLIAGPPWWAAMFAAGAVGFVAEAVWVTWISGWRPWVFRVGIFAALFVLVGRGASLLLSPMLGDGALVQATPPAVAWLMLAALVVLHLRSREAVR